MKLVPAAGIVGILALREAATTELTQVMNLVRAALQARFDAEKKPGESYCWYELEALFADRVIICKDGRYWQFGYSLDAANQVTLAEPVEVIEQFMPVAMREAAPSNVAFIEAKEGDAGAVWDVILIRSGLSLNSVFYPDAVLREAAPRFEGARVFAKGDAEHVKGDGKDVNKLAGWISAPRFVEGKSPDTGYVAGTLNLAPSALRTTLADAWARGKKDLVGLSIDANGTAKVELREAKKVRVARSISKVNSVDLIVEPGAGGGLVRLVEAAQPEEHSEMELKQKMQARVKARFPNLDVAALDDAQLEARYAEACAPEAPAPKADADAGDKPVTQEQLRMVEARAHARAAIAGSKLPAPAQERLQKRFDGLARFAEADVDAEIKAEREYLARFAESGRVQLGQLADVEVEDRSVKVQEMLDAFFDPAHKDHRAHFSFKEAYVEITGDRRVTGRIENMDRTRLAESLGAAFRESLDSTSFANVLGTSITRRLLADYRTPDQYSVWRPLVNVVPVADFRSQERTRFGGYGDLAAVNQGAAYQAMTSPTDEKATYAATKRGGTEDITLEMIKNDDVGAIRQIPVKLSRSAKRTLAKFVLDFVRTNPTLYDSVAFFHASHGNLGAAALDATSLAARRLAMLKQTEAGSSDRLGIPPKFLVVPVDLQEAAVNLFNRNTNNDKTFVNAMSLTIIPVWYWTDTNDWALAADPMDIPGIEVGFLDGNEEPEMFVQDAPNVGSMFSNDKLTYKIRHIYGGNVVEYRGWDKSVV